MSSTESIASDFESAGAASAGVDLPRSSLKSISLITFLTVLQLALQFALQLVLAKHFGAAGEMDAYVAALAWPVVIATIASSSLGYVLVPAVANQLSSGGPRDAAIVATQIGLGLIAVALVFTVGTAFAAIPLANVLCPGFLPAERELTARLLAALSLLILANSVTAYLNALFHSYGRFARPAVAGVVGMCVTLVYVIVLHGRQGIDAVAYGVVIGAMATTFILLPLFFQQIRVSDAGKRLHLHAGTRHAGALLVPLVLGAIYWRLDPLLDRYLGSYLPAGSIAHIGYAWRLVSGLMLIGTSGLSIVAFPAIAAHAAAGRRAGLNSELAHAIRFFLFLIVPICIGLCVFSIPVVRLLFERGRFTAADTAAVATMVVLYVGVIFGGGMGDLLSRTLYARHDTLTPVIVQSIAFTISAGLKFFLLWVAHAAGAAGLVAATSAFYLVNLVVLGAVLLRKLGPDMLTGSGGTLIRSVVSSAIACFAAGAVMLVPVPWAVLPAAACGALVYVGSMLVLRDEFAMKFYQRFFGLPAAMPREEQT